MRRPRNMSPSELAAWFWQKVTRSEHECWPWSGATHNKGYGNIGIDGRTTTTHRLAYTLAVGPIPPGMQVLHRCDNPPCCNPAHLFIGTHLDNMRDKIQKGRQARGERHGSRSHPESVPRGDEHPYRRCPDIVPRGEAHSHARLTEADVIDIRKAAAEGERQSSIAARYNVAQPTICNVVTRKTWAHVEK